MAWHLDKLLQETLEKGASDLHLSVGLPPIYRLYGELVPGSGPSLRAEDTAELAGRLLTREQMDLLNRRGGPGPGLYLCRREALPDQYIPPALRDKPGGAGNLG